jgi:hypothetical protein
MLIVGNTKCRYLQDISLNGTYDITVSNTSKIVETFTFGVGAPVTYDHNLHNLPVTNGITGSNITRVIIRYKTIEVSSVGYTPSGLLEYKNNNWIVNNYSTLSDISGSLPCSRITGTPATVTSLQYSSVTGTPTIPVISTTYSYNSITEKPSISTSFPYSSITGSPETLGVGITTSDGRLHVSGGTASPQLKIQRFFDYANNYVSNSLTTTTKDVCTILTLLFGVKVVLLLLVLISIKTNIIDVNDDLVVQKILGITENI